MPYKHENFDVRRKFCDCYLPEPKEDAYAIVEQLHEVVDDVIMPIVGAITGGVDFSNLFAPLAGGVTASSLEAAREQGAVLAYGSFITAVVNFLIVAFILFLVVRAANSMKKKEEEAAPAAPAADVVLLTEIRDLLKKR